jgi:hypothetical protein
MEFGRRLFGKTEKDAITFQFRQKLCEAVSHVKNFSPI